MSLPSILTGAWQLLLAHRQSGQSQRRRSGHSTIPGMVELLERRVLLSGSPVVSEMPNAVIAAQNLTSVSWDIPGTAQNESGSTVTITADGSGQVSDSGDLDGLPQSVAPAGLLIYYGYPSGINATFDVNNAAAEFARYQYVVLGDQLELSSHPDHANTVSIIQRAGGDNTMFFGYIDLGASTQNLSMTEIQQRIDDWKATGAKGIFLDDFGYDFGVTRSRQNAAVDYAHSVGLSVVANGFFVNQVFGSQVDVTYNPGGAATHLASTDYYLYESYQVSEGALVDASTWRAKADALAAVRQTLPINVFAVTTTVGAAFDSGKFDYAYWSAALDGYTAFGWGEDSFSSITASAPYRNRPSTDPGSAFTSPVSNALPIFTRDTSAGRIAVDTASYRAGFNLYDFGDAPDTGNGTGPGNYQTTAADNGPQHLVGGPRLGSSVDFETSPNLYGVGVSGTVDSSFGFGDNSVGHDEDGVTFTSLLQSPATGTAPASVTVNVQNASGVVRLDAWIDFNGDGDFNDPGEQIFTNKAVNAGDNLLTFVVPAGAASGQTYARFRISTAGNLAPTGIASDGEVEDYAVLISGPSSLGVIENAILSHGFSNGVLRSSNDPSFYQKSDGHAWYILDPYYSTLAVRALLAAPNNGSVDKFTAAARQLNFWLSQIQGNGTISRVIVDADFNVLTTAVESTFNDPQTGNPVVYDPATIGADADDSALAMMLSLASEYWSSGGPASVLTTQRSSLESVGNTLLGLIQANGLSNTFVDGSKPNSHTQYTLDNLEVLQALRQFSVLERDFYQDAVLATQYANAAAAVQTAIQNLLVDPGTQLYKWYAGGPSPNLNQWYPLVQDQVWPIITGLIPANSAAAHSLLNQVYAAWDGSPNAAWTNRTDAGWLAWAAVQAGDTSLASTSVQSMLNWALQNSQPNATAPMTIADLGFLLQSLLPAVSGPSQLTYVENATPTAINTGLVVSDLQSPTMSGASVSIANFVAGEDVLSFINDGATMGNIVGAFNSSTGVLTLTSSGATATSAQWQAALWAVTYANTSDAPDSSSRRVKFVLNDSLATSSPLFSTIAVQPVNDAPLLSTPGTITYTENDPATAFDSGLTLIDVDSPTLASAQVTITNFVAGQDTLLFTNDGSTMGNIAGSFSSSTGVLTLGSAGSTATVAQWQAALRSVKYFNSSDQPDTMARLIAITVNDGVSVSNSLVSTVNITAVDDAPVIDGFDATVTYPANSKAVVLDSNATVTDVDTARFNQGALTVHLTANGETGDRLEIRPVTRLIGVTGSNLTYRGTVIGTVAGGTGTTDLIVQFNASATLSAVQVVLRNITYRSVSASPSTAPRTVRVSVTDGAGGASNQPTKTIIVSAASQNTGTESPGTALSGVDLTMSHHQSESGTSSSLTTTTAPQAPVAPATASASVEAGQQSAVESGNHPASPEIPAMGTIAAAEKLDLPELRHENSRDDGVLLVPQNPSPEVSLNSSVAISGGEKIPTILQSLSEPSIPSKNHGFEPSAPLMADSSESTDSHLRAGSESVNTHIWIPPNESYRGADDLTDWERLLRRVRRQWQ